MAFRSVMRLAGGVAHASHVALVGLGVGVLVGLVLSFATDAAIDQANVPRTGVLEG